MLFFVPRKNLTTANNNIIMKVSTSAIATSNGRINNHTVHYFIVSGMSSVTFITRKSTKEIQMTKIAIARNAQSELHGTPQGQYNY
jgi:hypothetical protein